LANTTVTRPPAKSFLPPDPRIEEPFRLTPKLALRLAILGVVALTVFGILFLRLWALQVLAGTQYLRTAENNQQRTVRVPGPRGAILDRNGRVLVTNRAGTAVQIWPTDLPKTWPERSAELRALSRIVHVPVRQMLREIAKREGDPLTPVTVRDSVREDVVTYLSEHAQEFPGVDAAQIYLRQYPYQSLAAQTLGYVSEVSPEELKRGAKSGLRPGDDVGQAGVEAGYDSYLRGRAGLARLRVDSLGRPRSNLQLSHQPQPGDAVRLTLDLSLQQAAEKALVYGLETARAQGQWAANGGAIVALDPRDGSILALASNPTYKPSVFVGRVSPKDLAGEGLTTGTAARANTPALNRAIDATYPPGSIFKPATALAAVEERVVSPYESIPCTGSWTVDGHRFDNWDLFVNQGMTLTTALAASCDTYFYRIGYRFYGLPPERGPALQRWASRFGFGRPTGIDIGSEASGLLPTPTWRKLHFTRATDPSNWRIDSLWKSGDSIQLAIGQKDLLVTPLQMARFYALIANGGKLVTPHVVEDVEQPGADGAPTMVLRRFTQPPPVQTNLHTASLAAVRQGLWEATHASYGTSTAIFGAFPISISGKTGTAEKVENLDGYPRPFNQSWWCGYGPSDNARIVVCALIENGGHGGTAAAPAALRVFEAYFGKQAAAQGSVYSD
jgi:penicillin-binding protein 2